MSTHEEAPKPGAARERTIEDMIESDYKDFLNLRLGSTPYKILLYVFWHGKAVSPERIGEDLGLAPSTVRGAVRQLHEMGLLRCPKRGIYEPNRDRCLAMMLHVHRLLKEKLPKR